MPNERVLTGLRHTPVVRGEAQDDGALILPSAERAAARRLRGKFLRLVLRDVFRRVMCRLRLWRRRAAESHELAALSDRELRDMGISRYDAAHAAKQAFWRNSAERP
jgi:uncharacterized protein YjiS (DUF1127 family)